jgi:hypothetical protein
MVVNAGSKPLIFVPGAAHSPDLSCIRPSEHSPNGRVLRLLCPLEDNPPSLLKGLCILLERCHASFVTVEPEILMLALVSLLVLLVSANQFCGSVLTRTL